MADKASILFGSFLVGVRLTKVVSESNGTPPLKNLHAVCGTPINEQKVCKTCDRPVLADELAKGYVQSKNQIIPLTLDEVNAAKTPRSSVIEMVKFVDPLPPEWVDRDYWLTPEPLSEKAYYLLAKALQRQHVWGIATGAIWGKERPYAIEGVDGTLTLHILHTIQEFTAPPVILVPNVEAVELDMATKLVNAWTAPLEDDDLTVTGDSLMRSLIEAKIEGKEFLPPPPAVEPPPPPDLMKAMKETIAKAPKRRKKVTA